MSCDRPRRRTAPLLLIASFGLFWFSLTIADPDLWGHVRFGQDILASGSIPREDPYSYRSAGQTWINHEWLSEVIFAGLYDSAGAAGLISFKVGISLLILGLCYAHLRRGGLGPHRSAILLMLMCIPFRMGLGTIRPQIFTYLIFLLVLLVLHRASAGLRGWLYLLPILFVAWVNLHGGVLAGIGVLGLWGGTHVIARLIHGAHPNLPDGVGTPHLALVGVACGLALLVNPYGGELVEFLLRTGTVPRPEIAEWTPVALTSLPGQIDLLLLALGIAGFVASRRRRRPEAVLIFSTTAVLPLISSRHYPLFALAFVVLAGEHVADAWNQCGPSVSDRIRRGPAIAAILVLTSACLVALSVPRFGCLRIEPYYFPFPARAVALLRASGVRGNMAVPFEWGEYVIWHLGPSVKVSMDGRRETVYSDESYRQSWDFERGTGVWDALLSSSPTDLVLAANGSPTANLMSLKAGWVPLYQDSCCVIFIRADFPGIDRIPEIPVPAMPDNGDGLCFPVTGPRRAGAPTSS